MEEGQNVGFTSLSVPTRGPRQQQGGLPQRGHYRGPFDPTLLAGSMGNDSKHWQALGEVEANTWNRWDHLQASSLVGTVPNKLIVAKVSICIYMDMPGANMERLVSIRVFSRLLVSCSTLGSLQTA